VVRIKPRLHAAAKEDQGTILDHLEMIGLEQPVVGKLVAAHRIGRSSPNLWPISNAFDHSVRLRYSAARLDATHTCWEGESEIAFLLTESMGDVPATRVNSIHRRRRRRSGGDLIASLAQLLITVLSLLRREFGNFMILLITRVNDHQNIDFYAMPSQQDSALFNHRTGGLLFPFKS
jgi:hypothetical protein